MTTRYQAARVRRDITRDGVHLRAGWVVLAARWDGQSRVLWHGAELLVPDGAVRRVCIEPRLTPKKDGAGER